MKTIKILGTGCANCKTTEEVVRKVIVDLNLEIAVEKVEDIMDIMKYDVMSTPALVIDNTVKIKGRVPSYDEVKTLLVADSCCDDTASCCDTTDASSSCCEPSEDTSSCCATEAEEDTNSGSCCC